MPPLPPARRRTLRVGAVRYLNSRPLIEGLRTELPPGSELTLDHPSRLADGLRAGAFDAALVPSVAALGVPGATILPDACVAARGPVRSVKVYFRVPPGEVRTLALDEGSRTSAALARLLLAERYGVAPRCEPLPVAPAASPDAAAESLAGAAADAVLLIGDRAMHDPDGAFAAIWDLGSEWNAWTGLPFVFAVWAGRGGLNADDAGALADAFTHSRDAGTRRIDRIAATAAGPLGLTAADAAAYLRTNLHFTLGPAERAGLALFGELCVRNGLLAAGAAPRYFVPRPRPTPRTLRRLSPARRATRSKTPELLELT